MRFEEEPDEEAIHDCGGSVAGCDDGQCARHRHYDDETTTGAAGATVRIEPEYRTRIKSYVTEQKIRPVETRERIVVGAKVPTDVELTAVPSDWGPSVTKYRYVYSNDRVMLVDPGTRTVVHEID